MIYLCALSAKYSCFFHFTPILQLRKSNIMVLPVIIFPPIQFNTILIKIKIVFVGKKYYYACQKLCLISLTLLTSQEKY